MSYNLENGISTMLKLPREAIKGCHIMCNYAGCRAVSDSEIELESSSIRGTQKYMICGLLGCFKLRDRISAILFREDRRGDVLKKKNKQEVAN